MLLCRDRDGHERTRAGEHAARVRADARTVDEISQKMLPMQRTRPGVNREPSGRGRGRVSRAFALTTASLAAIHTTACARPCVELRQPRAPAMMSVVIRPRYRHAGATRRALCRLPRARPPALAFDDSAGLVSPNGGANRQSSKNSMSPLGSAASSHPEWSPYPAQPKAPAYTLISLWPYISSAAYISPPGWQAPSPEESSLVL